MLKAMWRAFVYRSNYDGEQQCTLLIFRKSKFCELSLSQCSVKNIAMCSISYFNFTKFYFAAKTNICCKKIFRGRLCESKKKCVHRF